jgi:ADP-ribose pyrophosphatase YjhB (NUDIX family)
MPIPCVDLVPILNDGRVLLVKRQNEPASRQWWFPGGRVHHGETRLAAGRRKLIEETGLIASTLKELGTYDVILNADSYLSHGITTVFVATIVVMTGMKLDTQSRCAEWLKPDEWLKRKLDPFVISILIGAEKRIETWFRENQIGI